jgi:glycosyltransferase involved in cell wall biosynthesis
MKIAQIVPIWIPIPPEKNFGGVETVVADLITGLTKLNHQVEIFASADSKINCKVNSVIKKAPLSADWLNYKNFELLNVINAVEDSGRFDILHFHTSIDLFPLMLSQFCKSPTVVTVHNYEPGTADDAVFSRYSKNNYISVNKKSQKTFPRINFIGNVYHGINIEDYIFQREKEDYLVFISRIEEKKGVLDAILVANALNLKLKILGPVSEKNLSFFEEKIKPKLSKNIEYLGPADLGMKNKILGKARAMIFPTKHQETFGLIIAESFACGTPVIAYGNGSIPEIIQDNVNGFSVDPDNLEKLTEATTKIFELNDSEYCKIVNNCRKIVETKFSLSNMAENYLSIYKEVINEYKKQN